MTTQDERLIKAELFPLKNLKRLDDFINDQAEQGYFPLTACHIPTSNGAGAVLFTMLHRDMDDDLDDTDESENLLDPNPTPPTSPPQQLESVEITDLAAGIPDKIIPPNGGTPAEEPSLS